MDNDIEYCINNSKFILKKQNDYYLIECDKHIDWLGSLNIYSVNKKPTYDKIIDKIKNKLNMEGTINIISKVDDNVNNDSNDSDDNNIQMDVLIHKELKRLYNIEDKQNYINDGDTKKLKKLFSDDTVKEIIINEYIKLWSLNNKSQHTTITDNIYEWYVEFYNINGINKIKLKINFDSKYFPYVPPSLIVTSPDLLDKLNYRISNSKLFKSEYWNPTTSMKDIIDRIKYILIKYALPNNLNMDMDENLYYALLKLSSCIDNNISDDIDVDINKGIEMYVPKSINKDKFNGTGYRLGQYNDWSVNDYEQIQKEKDNRLINAMNEVAHILNANSSTKIWNTIKNSMLIKFLHNMFNTNLLDIAKKQELYDICFNILTCICKIDISMMFITEHNIYNRIHTLYEMAKISSKINQEENDVIMKIVSIYSFLRCKFSETDSIDTEDLINTDDLVDTKDAITYVDVLSDYKFEYSDIQYNFYNKYLTELNKTTATQQCIKRLSNEMSILCKELPIHQDASIFLKVDENNPRCMRALITGPPDTPYDSGIFIFDIYIPPNYPEEVPCVQFINTGGKRFNPNLYACGKVCLSILGTYVGPQASNSEKWNSSSTLHQVLISIQSQILVDKPYFNEPGYQNLYGTVNGEEQSKKYNENIHIYTLQHAILDFLVDNRFKEFDSIIGQHFKFKKDRILGLFDKWGIDMKKYKCFNMIKKFI